MAPRLLLILVGDSDIFTGHIPHFNYIITFLTVALTVLPDLGPYAPLFIGGRGSKRAVAKAAAGVEDVGLGHESIIATKNANGRVTAREFEGH